MRVSSTLLAVLGGLAAVQAAALSGKTTAKKATSTCPAPPSTPVTTFTTTVSRTLNRVNTDTEIVSIPVSYTKKVTATQTFTSTVYTSTTTVTFPTTWTSTKTPYGSKTVTVPTPCGFTPALSEAIYHGPTTTTFRTVTSITSRTTVTQTSTYSTDVFTYTPTTTIETVSRTPIGQVVVTVETAPAQPTKTEYAACKKSNVALRDPGGNLNGIVLHTFKESNVFFKGVTQTAEECCSLCHATPLCQGSLWTLPTEADYQHLYARTCYIYTQYNSTACTPYEALSEVAPNPLYYYAGEIPPNALAFSNGPCGRIVPAPNDYVQFFRE